MKTLTLKVKYKFPVAPNVLSRQFNSKAPYHAWGTDIPYLWTQEGWVYLAIVIDLYSRRYVAVYYNAQRLHSTLGYQTPLDNEKTLSNVSGNG